MEFTIITENIYKPTEEEEQDFWNGDGHIEFFIIQNAKGNFEIEVTDYSGCAYGMQDTIGIDYYIEHEWCLNQDKSYPLREGVTYTIHDLSVTWTRGEWGFTDDDVDYEYSRITSHATAIRYLSYKIKMIWWRLIGSKFK